MPLPFTLCLLPGLLCDASVWEAQRRDLADLVEIRTCDFLGLDSIEAMARLALGLADGPLAVAGHSMGGRVALELLRQAPERVARLALLDTGVHPAGPAEPAQRQALVDLARREGMAALTRAWLPPMVHPDRLGDRALMAPLEAMVQRATPAIYEGQVRALLGRPDATGLLAGITCPTLVLVGREDSWAPVARHEQIAAQIPGATLRIIEQCGHMSTVERPDEVTAALRAWLA